MAFPSGREVYEASSRTLVFFAHTRIKDKKGSERAPSGFYEADKSDKLFGEAEKSITHLVAHSYSMRILV